MITPLSWMGMAKLTEGVGHFRSIYYVAHNSERYISFRWTDRDRVDATDLSIMERKSEKLPIMLYIILESMEG